MPENRALFYNSVPEGLPVVGKDLNIQSVPYPEEAPENGIVVKNLYGSFDPYLRGRMRSPEIKSYVPAFELNKPIVNTQIAQVIKSKNANFKEGDQVVGILPFQEYIALNGDQVAGIKHLQNPLGLDDIRYFLGALGMPGLTAYSSLYEIGKPKKGDTIFVSAASGAVGQLVGQLAKHEGLKVIGSVGSDEKLNFILKDLGFDAGFNYKKESPSQALKRLAPEGLDIYFENVGGDHLAAALDAMKDYGRVIVCGLIAGYNQKPEEIYPLRNYGNILWKRLTVRGFVVGDKGMGDKYADEHRERVSKWIKEGTFKAVTWEVEGIEQAGDGLLALFHGHNFGKAVLKY
ncbi:oxidoreductase, zinc-binding dehydrogenase family, putative [Talaromyces stipitatus ATCC 10500]|uniref:Oxidoreductase, zinc-binding dehydrogenase family, putative n=1 Tax=Talaromyces stipitatus (strain ATCC 10500 / CBS 375.48 / QM 6759 / NRRL 1006) TaxID=441959 RepID=B8M1W7_TALSN|nr:oxidoreductase, zinc-binding dehydrogenase family, putative [Talaromyces stipitatus ATCC 10500]EED21345.1 oxidoreductase, zinc-binding dehydrogenase family, putative [Talaromyces stipitatus ATCC 10500]